jgi:hypothetical protein
MKDVCRTGPRSFAVSQGDWTGVRTATTLRRPCVRRCVNVRTVNDVEAAVRASMCRRRRMSVERGTAER